MDKLEFKGEFVCAAVKRAVNSIAGKIPVIDDRIPQKCESPYFLVLESGVVIERRLGRCFERIHSIEVYFKPKKSDVFLRECLHWRDPLLRALEYIHIDTQLSGGSVVRAPCRCSGPSCEMVDYEGGALMYRASYRVRCRFERTHSDVMEKIHVEPLVTE